ncbi:MAG TPA: hypothetical protein VG899_12835 [Mycobacteriales bacterium]|nr:hypothetical protein [Mycobacteriales bacterium]
MPDRCAYLTATGDRCRRNATWRLSPAYDKPGCLTHTRARARALTVGHRAPLLLIEIASQREVTLTPTPVRRRNPFTVPTSPAAAVRTLDRVQSLTEWSQVFRAFLTRRWGPLSHTNPTFTALCRAAERLRATATPDELAAYTHPPLEVS